MFSDFSQQRAGNSNNHASLCRPRELHCCVKIHQLLLQPEQLWQHHINDSHHPVHEEARAPDQSHLFLP